MKNVQGCHKGDPYTKEKLLKNRRRTYIHTNETNLKINDKQNH